MPIIQDRYDIDYDTNLEYGRIPNLNAGNKFGYSTALGTSININNPSTWIDLWYPNTAREDVTSNFTPYFASDDAGDTSNTFVLYYLDSSGIEQTVTCTTDATNGQTAVSAGVTASEVYRAINTSTMSGNISIAKTSSFTSGEPTTATDLVAYIPAINNQTQQCMARVPSNKKRHIKRIYVSMLRINGSSGSMQGALLVKNGDGIWQTIREIHATSSYSYDRTVSGVVLDPNLDFKIQIRDISDTNTYVEGEIEYEDLLI